MLEYTIIIGGNYGCTSVKAGASISPAVIAIEVENFALQVTRLAGGCTITKAKGYWVDADGELVIEESKQVTVVGSADILPKLQSLVKVVGGSLWQDSILLTSRKLETVEFVEGIV